MKKAICYVLTFLTFLISVLCFTGCGKCSGLKLFRDTFENGYFVCFEPGGYGYIEVFDLTELGHKQKYIIMPETIKGKEYSFSKSRVYGTFDTVFSENNTLEKIYFEFFKTNRWCRNGTYNTKVYIDTVFEKCQTLKKVIVNNESAQYYRIDANTNQFIYCLNICSKPLYTNYQYLPSYTDENGNEIKCLVKWGNRTYSNVANVEFMYNYEDAPNYGYYWIDDIDDGEKLEITPPDPAREGYTFEGWYCEAECINRFDFETKFYKKELEFFTQHIYVQSTNNKTYYPDIVYDLYTYPEDYVTYIYAKWSKN